MCTKCYDHMMYSSLDMVGNRQMDRRTENATYRDGSPPKNNKQGSVVTHFVRLLEQNYLKACNRTYNPPEKSILLEAVTPHLNM